MAPFFSDAQIANTLANVPLFSECSMPQVRQIAQAGMIVSRDQGADVVAEGTHGVAFFVLLAGSVTVSRDGEKLDTMAAGDFFGETALIKDEPRNATIVADTDVHLFALTAAGFKKLVLSDAAISYAVMQALASRAVEG